LNGLSDHTGGSADRLNIDGGNVEAFKNLTEDNVLSVEPRAGNQGDEELGAVGVTTGVGHGEETGSNVLSSLSSEGLVGELHSVNAFAAGSVGVGEVTTLEHELGNDAVEDASLVVEGLAGAAHTLFTGAEAAEVFSGLGADVLEEFKGDSLGGLLADGDVKEDDGVSFDDGEGGLEGADFREAEHIDLFFD